MMSDIFATIGVVITVFGGLLFASLFMGLQINRYDWELPAWICSLFIATGIISAFILRHILKMP